MISIYAPRQCRLPQKLFVQGVLAAAAKKMGQRLVVHKTPQDLKDHGLRSSHFNHTYIVFFSLFGRTGLHRKLMRIWLWLATCLRGRAEMRVHGQPLNFVTDLKKNTSLCQSSVHHISHCMAQPVRSGYKCMEELKCLVRELTDYRSLAAQWLAIRNQYLASLEKTHFLHNKVPKKQRRAKSYRKSALFPKRYLAQGPPLKTLMIHLQKPQEQVVSQLMSQRWRNQCHSGRPTTYSVRSVAAKFLGVIFLMNKVPPQLNSKINR